MKNKTTLDQVNHYLRQQLECYELLQKKMGEQKNAIDQVDEKRLLAIIEEKDVLIATFQKHEEGIAAAVKGISEGELNNILQATAGLRGQIEAQLKQLVAQENICAELMNNAKNRVHEQIRELQQKKNILKKYGRPGEGMSWFSNKV